MTPALIAFVIVQLSDIATTVYALRRGWVEGNPILRAIIRRIGGYGWVVFKATVASGIALWAYIHGDTLALWILTGVTGLAAFNNVRLSHHRAETIISILWLAALLGLIGHATWLR